MSDVLVVGAGPTGLTVACELLRRGVGVRLVDAAHAPVDYSKALLVWPRTADVLGALGLAGELPRHAIRINAFRYFSAGRPLSTVRFTTDLAPWALPQRSTEALLTARLHALGGRIERGIRLLALDRPDFSGDPSASTGVTAILELADGTVERYTAPWLVGADGAGSAVRAQLGLGFTGATYPSNFVLADARISGRLPADEALYYQSPAGVLVVVALPDGVFRFFASAPPATGRMPAVDLPMVQRLVDERGPGGVRLVDPQWVSGFRVHRRQTTEFQLGRTFLIGDAAHVHSPAGGQGLNTGIQDAHNLAWKLAAVVRGEATTGLLASYTPERHRVAAAVVRDTDLQTRAWMLHRPAQVALRDAAFRLADRSGVIEQRYVPVLAGRRIRYAADDSVALLPPPRRCEDRGGLRVGAAVPPALAAALDLHSPDADPAAWTLLTTEPLPAPLGGTVRARVAPEVLAAGTRCRHTVFVLVRPDGVVAARGHRRDLGALERWYTTLQPPGGSRRPLHAVDPVVDRRAG
jgi:2-polyprenyl-6-methoxyphenol hydroxylase-like FAD-dependent oxidoreductase